MTDRHPPRRRFIAAFRDHLAASDALFVFTNSRRIGLWGTTNR
jgi:hypothetical protein